jgi:23S rRNA pseudouridine2605 synthase
MKEEEEKGVRLNRYLASCGVASRRACDALILEGRVELNGKITVDLASRVFPGDHVKFDGKMLRGQTPLSIVLNKPKKFLCTKNDPEGRDTIYQLLPKTFSKLHYVGRLDYDSSGLILLTSDGELTERLAHPRYHVEKEYEVLLDHAFAPEYIPTLLEGFQFPEGLAKAEAVAIETKRRLRVILTQGYNRQIRRMFSKIGYKVARLERIRIGSLVMPELSTGEYHILTHREIEAACVNPQNMKRSRRPRGNDEEAKPRDSESSDDQ